LRAACDGHEDQRRAKCGCVGHDAAERLFPYGSPIGKDIDCEGDIFTVDWRAGCAAAAFGAGAHAGQLGLFPGWDVRKIHPEILDFWITVKYDDPSHKALGH